MTWGAEEKNLRDFESESGIVSKALSDKPELSPRLIYYYDEFNAISPDRRLDSGYPTPLTTGDMDRYCNFFDVENRMDFHKYIRMIDNIYLAEFYKKEKAKNAK